MVVQADRMHSNKPPLCKALMAPPKLKPRILPGGLLANDPAQRTLHEVMSSLGRWFELGTIYTAIAGLLNVLAIYDAACGPVLAPAAKKGGGRRRSGPRRGRRTRQPRRRNRNEQRPLVRPAADPSRGAKSHAATRHERLGPILVHAVRLGLSIFGVLAVILVALAWVSWLVA